MTDTFTPPTTFPHECRDTAGNVVWLHGASKHPELDFAYVGEIIRREFVTIDRWEPTLLRDKPKVTSTWVNVYPRWTSIYYPSREAADAADKDATKTRVAVLRQDTLDGVTTCELEGL